MRNKARLSFLDCASLFIIAGYFLYSFWFQYGVKVIDGLFTVFGVFFVFLSVSYFYKSLKVLKQCVPVIAFIAVLLFETIVFSLHRDISMLALTDIVKYVLPMIGISCYVGYNIRKFKSICLMVLLSTFLLCIFAFTHPEIRTTGAISVGELNTNVLSSFLLIQLVCGLYLLVLTKNKLFRFSLICVLILGFFTQFRAASRRGVIVYFFALVIYLIACFIVKNRHKPKIAFIPVIIFLVCGGVYLFLTKVSNLTFIERLLSSQESNNGDQLRGVYQTYAISLFKSHPIFGAGLNSVALGVGDYSHNLYTELLACSGIIGFISFGAIIYSSLKKSIKRFCSNKNLAAKYFYLISILTIGIILISGIAVVQFYDMYFYILVAVLLSSLNVCSSRRFSFGTNLCTNTRKRVLCL